MLFARRFSVFAISALLLSGCQTTVENKWVSANNTASSTNENSTDTAISNIPALIIDREEMYEVGRDPYAYRSIPPNSRPVSSSTEGGLWYAFDKAEDKSRTAGNLIRDDELQSYLDGIVCKLSGPYCGDIRVYIQEVPAFNATMAPNGMMSIWSGFILRAQNEAQLAAVIGHEIGHYIRRHGIQRLEDKVAKSDFGVFVTLVGAAMGVPVAGDIVGLLFAGSILSFSRDNEREADLIGIHLLAKNGYDTREAAKVWQQIISENDPDGESSSTTTFLGTHPSSAERQETLSQLANELQGEGKWGKVYQERFNAIVGPWKQRFMEDDIRLGKWDETLRLIEILEESGTPNSHIAFYRGEVYRKRGQEGDSEADEAENQKDDVDRAIAEFKKAISDNTSIANTYRSLGLSYQSKGMNAEAKRAFIAFLERVPNAKDAKMIKYMIDTMGAPIS